jgi:hypothetical protein
MSNRFTKQHAFILVRHKAAESLSPLMWELLSDLKKYEDAFFSVPDGQMANAIRSAKSLQKRGLVDDDGLTEAGEVMLTVQWRDAE